MEASVVMETVCVLVVEMRKGVDSRMCPWADMGIPQHTLDSTTPLDTLCYDLSLLYLTSTTTSTSVATLPDLRDCLITSLLHLPSIDLSHFVVSTLSVADDVATAERVVTLVSQLVNRMRGRSGVDELRDALWREVGEAKGVETESGWRVNVGVVECLAKHAGRGERERVREWGKVVEGRGRRVPEGLVMGGGRR
ncbi:hypothetical protein HDU98_006087, partial [Podochytrium sp. JEL0797]